jgi:O-6-methylguanine DNA methyltransferase
VSNIPTSRDVEAALTELAVEAPSHLEDRILAAIGIADRMAVIAGPLGPLCIVFNDHGVVGCAPAEKWEHYAEHHPGRPVVEVDDMPARLADQVRRSLDTGKLGRLPVDLSNLTDFQQAVLLKTAEIPPGEIRPYGWIAKEIGKPGAVRAVGSALNRNPIPVLIPCHRVGRSDGHIGEYAYGPRMKRSLLEHEGLDPDEVEALADRGVRYVGTRNGHDYCLPTCRYVKRIYPENRVEFRSAKSAADAGYTPCSVCRPEAMAG